MGWRPTPSSDDPVARNWNCLRQARANRFQPRTPRLCNAETAVTCRTRGGLGGDGGLPTGDGRCPASLARPLIVLCPRDCVRFTSCPGVKSICNGSRASNRLHRVHRSGSGILRRPRSLPSDQPSRMALSHPPLFAILVATFTPCLRPDRSASGSYSALQWRSALRHLLIAVTGRHFSTGKRALERNKPASFVLDRIGGCVGRSASDLELVCNEGRSKVLKLYLLLLGFRIFVCGRGVRLVCRGCCVRHGRNSSSPVLPVACLIVYDGGPWIP